MNTNMGAKSVKGRSRETARFERLFLVVGVWSLARSFGDEAQKLFGGDEEVAVAVHLSELFRRAALSAPFMESDLPVVVGVELDEPFGQAGRQLAVADGERRLILGRCLLRLLRAVRCEGKWGL